MKKWFTLLAICLLSVAFTTPIQDRKIDPVALGQLISAFDIPNDADIVQATQLRWLRKPNQERWEVTELLPDQRNCMAHRRSASGSIKRI